jgi:hypothetical protein
MVFLDVAHGGTPLFVGDIGNRPTAVSRLWTAAGTTEVKKAAVLANGCLTRAFMYSSRRLA